MAQFACTPDRTQSWCESSFVGKLRAVRAVALLEHMYWLVGEDWRDVESYCLISFCILRSRTEANMGNTGGARKTQACQFAYKRI